MAIERGNQFLLFRARFSNGNLPAWIEEVKRNNPVLQAESGRVTHEDIMVQPRVNRFDRLLDYAGPAIALGGVITRNPRITITGLGLAVFRMWQLHHRIDHT